MSRVPIGQVAKGKWADILPKLGVEERFLVNRGGPCPMCDGKDRFRWDNKDGTGSFYCNQCGNGSGVDLVMKVNGWEFKEAAQEIEKHAGTAKVVPIRAGRSASAVKADMNAIWQAAKPLETVPAVAAWWMRRLGEIPVSTELRAVYSLRCGQQDFSAMIAKIRDTDGKPVSLQRVYVAADGQKAPLENHRRVMDISLPKGCAVRLHPVVSGELGVAEGIENAVSCYKMFGVPTWALLSANNMMGFTPPESVRRLVIYGDRDASFTGQAATFHLAKSLWARREKLNLTVEVRIPGLTMDAGNMDWNNVHMDSRA